MQGLAVFVLLLALSLQGFAQPATELVEVLPLTAEILMLRFDEGYVDYHEQGETFEDDIVVVSPLDVVAASAKTSYTLTSLDDPAYATAQQPLRVNRKSKPTEFAGFCLADNGRDTCVNPIPDLAKEHYLYLHLPVALTNGRTYTLELPGLPTQPAFTWIHNDRILRSEAVHVNLIGYVPSAGEKYGYVYHWMGDGGSLGLSNEPRDFYLVDEVSDEVAFSGSLAFRRDSTTKEIAYESQSPPFGNLIGSDAWECDFSSFRQNGSYRLCVDGVGCSFPFEIGDDIYREPLDLAIMGLYQQRSGVALETPYTDVARPAPHNPGITPGFAGRLKYSSISASDYSDGDNPADQADQINASVLGDLDAWGWYQDAGDWDGYRRHSAVPMQLLWLYEMHASKWGDGQLNLPEQGNGLPDLLDEALWLPRFLHRLRKEMIEKGYGTGGVGGSRVFGDLNGFDDGPNGELRGSWEDTDRDWIVSGEDALMTYAYAGVAAHAAILLLDNQLSDPGGVSWVNEAQIAYTWAAANTTSADLALTEESLEEYRMYAAANLYRVTAERQYELQFEADFNATVDNDLSDPMQWAYASYRAASDEHPSDPALVTAVKQRIATNANFWAEAFRDDRSARWAGNWFVPLIIGQGTTPLVQPVIVGHYFSQDDDPASTDTYRDALYSTADYFLGTNPLNQTWITGLGERSPKQVFNLDSWVLNGDTARRGVTPYGPWTQEFLGFFSFVAPYTSKWAFIHTYPVGEDAWPGHERWFDQRPAPLTAEYTVDQNMGPNILTYGYLWGLTAPDFVPSSTRQAHAKTAALQVIPNPARGMVRLNAEAHGEVHVTDLRGVEVLRTTLALRQPLDLSALPAGSYRIEVLDEARTQWQGQVVLVE